MKKEVISEKYTNLVSTREISIDKCEVVNRDSLEEHVRNILFKGETEYPGSSVLLNNFLNGVYYCKGCNNPLFSSEAKFKSSCGWPSFESPIVSSSIKYYEDNSLARSRVEITCSCCGGHLGHVFDDGPTATKLRYCVNGAILNFVEDEAV